MKQPFHNAYDPSGRMIAMRTYRGTTEITSAADLFTLPTDRTTWSYDQSTGLLTNKLYADGKGTAYAYTPYGQLASRAWARGVTTTYAYTNGSSLAAVGYSDDTPDVAFAYDRLGRQVSAIVDGVSTNTYTYDSETLALSVETQNGLEINRTTDALGLDIGFSLGSVYGVQYGYDTYGRFSSLRALAPLRETNTFTYSYLPNTDLLSGMSASSGFLWTRAYESGRSLITSVENSFGETVISRYNYTNDELGRRTSRADSGLAFAAQPTYGDPATVEMPAYNAYSYNTRSEVTGAARRWGTPGASGDLVLGQQYAYEFDGIGNRITAAEGDTDRTASYTANELNQYTQRTVPDEKDLIGTAPTNVAVTVNAVAVTRQNAYWHHALEVDNATDAAYPQVAISAVYNPPGTNDPDVVTSQTGHVYVVETPESFTYDDDGNLTQDGRFAYTWNGENRLIKAETRDDLPAAVPRMKVEYAYDNQGRMVWKQVSTNAFVFSTRTLLWDGYNIVRSLTHSQTHTLTNSYLWGLDLSSTLQSAGGVGGLLAEVQDGEPYFAAFDANGNVTEYISTNGALAAHYEYSPFGEIVVQSGDLGDSFTHRFSTKPWCRVTGLSEYEMRKYSPCMGRWPNRDPINELGHKLLRGDQPKRGVDGDIIDTMRLDEERNLQLFVFNNPMNRIDYLGLGYHPGWCCNNSGSPEWARAREGPVQHPRC
jgi:RHS repeat-associated protein